MTSAKLHFFESCFSARSLSRTCRPRPLCAQRGDDEEEVAQDGDHDRDHVQGDPAPLENGIKIHWLNCINVARLL